MEHIYGRRFDDLYVAKEAPKFLNEETLTRIGAYSRELPVSHTLQIAIAKATVVINGAMKFRKDHWSYVPAVSRSVILILLMLLLVSTS